MVHRVNSQKATERPIITQFSNRSTNDDFLVKCKSRKPVTVTGLIFEDSSTVPIYVNEHLTPYYRDQMTRAKDKVEENGSKKYKYVWFKNSKLFIRKSEASNIIRIRSINNLS